MYIRFSSSGIYMIDNFTFKETGIRQIRKPIDTYSKVL